MDALVSIESLIKEFDECAPNPTEFIVLGKALVFTKNSNIESILRSWSAAFDHDLRESGQRNPFIQLNHSEARKWVVERLTQELVFRGKGMHEEHAFNLANSLFAQLGKVHALVSDYTINDWTFCDVIIMSDETCTLLLAFLGED